MSDVNKKIANLSEKLVEISNTSLSEAVVTKIVNSSSHDFFTFKDATLKFINSFTADVIGAVERVEKLTPPTTPRNHFTNNLKSSLELYNNQVENISATNTPLNSVKSSLEYSSTDTPLVSTKVSQETKI